MLRFKIFNVKRLGCKYETDFFQSFSTFFNFFQLCFSPSGPQERMRVEWKISEKISSELLMKRVKKMKGRRKKDLGADEKLKKFQLLRNNNCESDVKFVKRNKNDDTKKVDYFKGLLPPTVRFFYNFFFFTFSIVSVFYEIFLFRRFI